MTGVTTPPPTPLPHRATASRSADLAAFLAGGLAAGLAIAIGELMAGLIVGAPSLVIAIGDFIIENQPDWAKDVAVGLFGTNDKLALNASIVIGAVLIAGLLGVAGRRSWNVPLIGFGIAGALGLLAALTRPLVSPLWAVITVVGAIVVALVALRLMLAATSPAWATGPPPAPASDAPVPAGGMPDWDRRRFLQVGGGVAVGAVVLGVLGRNLLTSRPAGGLASAQLPSVAAPLPKVPAGASLDVEGISPIVVPNGDFYRIDTALISPRVDADTWTLTVKGMVDREVTLTYDDLRSMPLFEQYVTIACVSNEVGGRLVGNALWTGVDLRSVLDMAGVHPDADQIVGRSVDGFTTGFPTQWAMDPDRRPMIAIGMNGQPLPVDHGYPARLIIPGLYGYVSATKWLSEIELTTLEAFDAYWVPLGWAKEAPILTQSRIDTPRNGARLAAGAVVPIAGVAWAPDRGVSRVEVLVDDGQWQEAQLSDPLTDAAWVQWKLPWTTPSDSGRHRIQVRATDGKGVVQTAEIDPATPRWRSRVSQHQRLGRLAPSRRLRRSCDSDGALDERVGLATDPDGAIRVAADAWSAGPPQRGALADRVWRGHPSASDQPLCQRGIEAAGHRILDDGATVVAEDGAHLIGALGASRVRAHDADIEAIRARRWPQRQHSLGRLEQHRHPAGTVVDPLAVHDGGLAEAEDPRRSATAPPHRPAPNAPAAVPRRPARHRCGGWG